MHWCLEKPSTTCWGQNSKHPDGSNFLHHPLEAAGSNAGSLASSMAWWLRRWKSTNLESNGIYRARAWHCRESFGNDLSLTRTRSNGLATTTWKGRTWVPLQWMHPCMPNMVTHGFTHCHMVFSMISCRVFHWSGYACSPHRGLVYVNSQQGSVRLNEVVLSAQLK